MAKVKDRRLARLRSLRALEVVEVSGAGTQQIGQDDWLTRRDESGYPTCRRWASAVRTWAPSADGLTWASKRENGPAFVVRQSDAPTFELVDDEPIDTGGGRLHLEDFLRRWRLYLDDSI